MSLPSNEQWRPIEGYEGCYEVSNTGRIRSLRKGVQVLSLHANMNGYPTVKLYRHGTRTSFSVHRLVAFAFCEPRPGCTEVRHLDGNPHNNNAENLAWGTRSDNMQDALRHGTHYWASRTHCARGHEWSEQNTAYRKDRPGSRYCLACRREDLPRKRPLRRRPPRINLPHSYGRGGGYKGVSQRRQNSWSAKISAGKQRGRHLGTFRSPEDAARAYDAAARERWGPRAVLNFPDEWEGRDVG